MYLMVLLKEKSGYYQCHYRFNESHFDNLLGENALIFLPLCTFSQSCTVKSDATFTQEAVNFPP